MKFGTGITPRKIKKGQYGIFMPRYGVFLDSMKTHAIALKKGRLITKWARQKGIMGKFMTVRAHPYLDVGFAKMVNRANITAQNIANKIVR